MDDMSALFAEVDAVRRTLGDRSAFRDPATLRELARRIEGTSALRQVDVEVAGGVTAGVYVGI
jgi:hypothetical protein